jgi:hypothetical protein
MSKEVYKSIDNKSIVYPLVYYSHHDGITYIGEDYGMHRKTGEAYSKKSGEWKKMKITVGKISKKNRNEYPTICLSGITKIDRWGNKSNAAKKSMQIHRAVASTLIERPDRHHDFDDVEWRNLKLHNKRKQLGSLEVNHIDHDKYNFHPNNLEWTNREENIHAYVEHNEQRKAA